MTSQSRPRFMFFKLPFTPTYINNTSWFSTSRYAGILCSDVLIIKCRSCEQIDSTMVCSKFNITLQILFLHCPETVGRASRWHLANRQSCRNCGCWGTPKIYAEKFKWSPLLLRDLKTSKSKLNIYGTWHKEIKRKTC